MGGITLHVDRLHELAYHIVEAGQLLNMPMIKAQSKG
jgi:hypothetical protein